MFGRGSTPLGVSSRSRLDWVARGAAWVSVNSSDIATGSVSLCIFNASPLGRYLALYAFLANTAASGNSTIVTGFSGHFGTQLGLYPQAVHTGFYAITGLKPDDAISWVQVQCYEQDSAAAPDPVLWRGAWGGTDWFELYAEAPLCVIPSGWSLRIQTDPSGSLACAALLGPWP